MYTFSLVIINYKQTFFKHKTQCRLKFKVSEYSLDLENIVSISVSTNSRNAEISILVICSNDFLIHAFEELPLSL